MREDQIQEEQVEQDDELFDPDRAAQEYGDDEEFDFGKAKMDFFK